MPGGGIDSTSEVEVSEDVGIGVEEICSLLETEDDILRTSLEEVVSTTEDELLADDVDGTSEVELGEDEDICVEENGLDVDEINVVLNGALEEVMVLAGVELLWRVEEKDCS